MRKFFSIILLLLIACSPVQPQEMPAPEFTSLVIPSVFPTNSSAVTVTPTWSGNYDDMIETASAMQTEVAQFPRICSDNYSPNRYSPNGLWLEELCYSSDDKDLILTIANKKTQVLWKLLYKNYIPQLDFSPDGGMAVAHWTKDGRYAYFFSFLGGDGHHCFVKGWDTGAGLFRLDLQTGETNEVLPPNTTYWWYSFSFSPTDKRLVYGVQAEEFHILDIKTGQTINVEKSKGLDEGGGVVWSHDGLQFVYSTIFENSISDKFETSIRLVDAQTGNEKIILETINNCYVVREWTTSNILVIESYAEKLLIKFDLNSNTIIP